MADGAGSLVSADAVLSGFGAAGIVGSGALASEASTITAVTQRGYPGTGTLISQPVGGLAATVLYDRKIRGITDGVLATVAVGDLRLNYKKVIDGDSRIVATAAVTGQVVERPIVTARVITAQAELTWENHGPNTLKVDAVAGGTLKFIAGFPRLNQSTVEVTGRFTIHRRFRSTVTATMDPTIVVRLRWLSRFRGIVAHAASLSGTLKYITLTILEPDAAAVALGHRPSIAPVSYFDDVHTEEDVRPAGVWGIEAYQMFYMAQDYVGNPLDGLRVFGARPGAIGMRVPDDGPGGTGELVMRFRSPRRNEIIYSRTQGGLRWDGTRWAPHSSMPERAIRDQRAFNQTTDPDGVYDYYAAILGMVHAQMGADTERLRDLPDPVKCPDAFIGLLANSYGAEVDYELPISQKREIVKNFVPVQKLKGQPDAVIIALHSFGFSGYIAQVWVNPLNNQYREVPVGYSIDMPVDFFPSSRLVLHLNALDGDVLTTMPPGEVARIVEFLGRNVIPAASDIRYLASDFTCGTDTVAVSDGLTVTEV